MVITKIKEAVSRMRERNIQPQAMYLISDDYDSFISEVNSMCGIEINNIDSFEGLRVFRAIRGEEKSFISVMLNYYEIPPGEQAAFTRNKKLGNEHFRSNLIDFIEMFR